MQVIKDLEEWQEAYRSLGRLLEVQHTLLSLAQLQLEHYDPDVAKTLMTEAACKAGVASEHTSLLKLSLPEQFEVDGAALVQLELRGCVTACRLHSGAR